MYQIRIYLVSAVPTQPAALQGEGCSSSEGWYVYQHFHFDFPFDDIPTSTFFHSYQIRINSMYNTCNNLSLLEGLEFTHPSSARTKGDDTRYYVYTYLVRCLLYTSPSPRDS